MGRGDRRTKKGKVFARSHGNTRLRKKQLTISEATSKLAAKRASVAAAAERIAAAPKVVAPAEPVLSPTS